MGEPAAVWRAMNECSQQEAAARNKRTKRLDFARLPYETPKFQQLLPGNGGLLFTLARLLLLKHHRSLELLYALKLEGILRFC